MVHFLISLILTLMIFIPACYLVSGIFRTSEQAKDNYSEFVKELNGFLENGRIGEQKSILLIMDEGTAIVYFEKETQKTVIKVDAELLKGATDYSINLFKPGQCDDNKNCLCLFRDSKFEADASKSLLMVTPKNVLCTNLDYNLEVETCSIGEARKVNSYVCEGNNFMIERNLAKRSSWKVISYYEIPRRTVLYFTKLDGNVIHLIGNYGGRNE